MLPNLNCYGDYRGLGHRPKDFDAFWKEGLEEVERSGTEFELEKEDLPSKVADFYHLWFTGVGGDKVHCQLVVPKGVEKGEKRKGILLFHGYHCDSGDFSDKVGWAAEGYVVLAMDARGQGGLSEYKRQATGDVLHGLLIRGIEEKDPEKLYFRDVFLDTAKAAKILQGMDFVDEGKIFAQGASQGGGLALACCGLVPDIYKVQVCYPFLSDYRAAYAEGCDDSAFDELGYWFRYRDPLHKNEDEFFRLLDYVDVKYLAENIKAEVVMAVGLKDTVVFPKTQMAAFNRIKSRKRLLVLPEYRHEYLPKISDELREFFEFGK